MLRWSGSHNGLDAAFAVSRPLTILSCFRASLELLVCLFCGTTGILAFVMTAFAASLIIMGANGATGAGEVVARLLANLNVQVPEPGMTLLFGVGAGLLGLGMGRRRSK